MADISKLPEDGESVGVNQIRNKVNEIIEEGVGGGGGSVIDVGDVGVYSSNLANELLISPPAGSNSNEGLRNTHPTYIPNGATEKLTDFPVHTRRITDDTALGVFAILLNGKLYIGTGNGAQHIEYRTLGGGPNDCARPGLENIREFNLGGYYQRKPDVTVLDFHLSITYCVVLMSDGILWGWGRQNQGQLGQGNTTSYDTPIIVDTEVTRMWGVRGVKQYQGSWNDYDNLYWQTSKDPYHTIRAAGYNGQGQLGDGTTVTTGSSKPYVLMTYSHLHDFTSYRIKQVYNYSGVNGFVFIVLQHSTDARVQQVVACGYNGYSNLGFDRFDAHTTFGPSKNPANSGFAEVIPTNTSNVSRLVWCKDVNNHPSWTPTWQCYHDSCSIEILGFYGGFFHGGTAGGDYTNPWAACWSRVWSSYGQTQGEFLRTAGSNNYGMLGALDPGFGRTSVKNSNYKTYKYIPHKSGGYTWDEALADAPNQLSGAKLAAPMSRADWNRLSINIVENFSKPGASDLHHAWLGLTDEEGEGWWKNHHTNLQADKLYIPFSRPQADDAGTSRFLQGYAEYVYYNPSTRGVRSEDFTESEYTGSGETDGIRADNYFNNSANAAGRGVHDMISIGRGETTTNNYTFIAETYCSNTTTATFKGRIWRSTSTTSRGSYANSADTNKFSTSNIHPGCNQYNGYKLHYINPYVGKFVHLDDIGDLVYISWHHDNNQLICARTADLGGTWRYHYSDIEGAWGQRRKDAGYHVSNAGEHTDGGVTSAVYLGQGVIVAAFGGAYQHSGLGIAEGSNSQALLVRSFDYGKNWHLIGDTDLDFTFSNLTPEANYASHFNVGRYYDVMSNKFRLICFAGSGGTTGQGYYSIDGFGWTLPTSAFAMAYSDDFGDTWNWCQIDGTEQNFDLMDGTAWPDNSNFRGDSMHFCMQQSKVYIVRTHFEKALESNRFGATRQNWGETNNAWTYVSSDGGKTFGSTMPGYLDNLYQGDSDIGIVSQNGVYNKGGGDLNNTGVPVQTLLLGKSYRNIMKLEPYGTDGVAVFWQRNSDQEYQVTGYSENSSLDNNTIPVVNYKNLIVPAAMDPRWGVYQLNDNISPTSVVSDYPGNGTYWPYAWFANNGTGGNWVTLSPTDSFGNAPNTDRSDFNIVFDLRWSARVFAVDYDNSETEVGKIAFMVNGFNNRIWVRDKTNGANILDRTIWTEGPSSPNLQAGWFRLEYECEIYAIDKTNWNTEIRPEILDSDGIHHIPGGGTYYAELTQQVPSSWKQWNKIPRWEFIRDNFGGDPLDQLQLHYPWAYEMITQLSDRITTRNEPNNKLDFWQTRDLMWKRFYPGNLTGNFTGNNFYYEGDINDLSWITLAYYPGTTRNIDEIDDDPFMNVATKISDTPANVDDPMQPEHRITLISDIMNPSVVRNAGNVVDYFMGPYHYSWGTNATYKNLFNQGSHLLGCSLATGDLAFIQGGYGNLNYGYGILAYAKKFDQTWIGFGEGENHTHTMAGSFVGYDGWRDLSSANKVSSNNFIFNAGGAMYASLNDVGGPSSTRFWGDYNDSTRYFGYWIEKEVNIDTRNGTAYLARDSADGKPCVDVAIPEINRFTAPTVSSENTNLVDDPVTQIRDIRVHGSGPGGLIITLSNGKVWTTGYNGLSQRGNWSYTNEHDNTSNLDYPTMVPHPDKVDNTRTWDKCMLAIAPYGTHDHYTSILMRDSENEMWGWGYNNHGELGLGHNTTYVKYPERTRLPQDIFPSVMGQMSTTSNGPIAIMISNKGTMYAAGYNGHNAIAEGEGSPSMYNIFIPIRNPLA